MPAGTEFLRAILRRCLIFPPRYYITSSNDCIVLIKWKLFVILLLFYYCFGACVLMSTAIWIDGRFRDFFRDFSDAFILQIRMN